MQKHPPSRGFNRAAILQLLRRKKFLSRSELAQLSGLSQASVSRITKELMDEGLVVERGLGRSTGGRPRIHLCLNETRYRAIGIDLHDWQTRFSVSTLDGRIVESHCFSTASDPYQTMASIVEHAEAYRAAHKEYEVVGIGVGSRGFVNARTGVVERGSDPTWQQIPLGPYLREHLGIPVYVDNVVRAAALAEYHHGDVAIQGAHCLIFVQVDEGIGVGMMLDGATYYGPSMAAGEFGQMVIAETKDTARHDRSGCLEMLASNKAILRRYRNANGGHQSRSSGDLNADVRQICQEAARGNMAATLALTESCRYLGIGLSNIVWGLDPDVIVIDGAITEAWPLVKAVIQGEFADSDEFFNFRNLQLRPSSFSGDAAIIGAAALPFDPLFRSGEFASILTADPVAAN